MLRRFFLFWWWWFFFFCCEEVYYEGVVYWLDDVYENGMNDVEEGCQKEDVNQWEGSEEQGCDELEGCYDVYGFYFFYQFWKVEGVEIYDKLLEEEDIVYCC